MKHHFLYLLMLLPLLSCAEAIDLGDIDETPYSNALKSSGYLRDRTTGKSERTLEMHAEDVSASLVFGLSKASGKGTYIVLEYAPEYADTYNASHGTDYPAFPDGLVTFENNGKILLAPDDKLSYASDIHIAYSDMLENGRTYILPVRAMSETEGVYASEEEAVCVYLVKVSDFQDSAFKGAGAVKNIVFFEVNDTNPLNALEFKTAEGALFFDFVVLFAANINYDSEKGEVYVNFNPQVQFLMDNNEQYIQPLRRAGIKVLLGILGNHDPSGLAQLSDLGAREFARQLADICEIYKLDGVNFDDEWSNPPSVDSPLFADHSEEAGARLNYETKKAMPDKYVTVYDVGYSYADVTIDGVVPGDYIDIGVGLYSNTAPLLTGMTREQVTGMSFELNRNPTGGNEEQAKELKENGYGYCMFFALYAANADYAQRQRHITSVDNVCRGLYDMGLSPVEYYYPFQSAERIPISQDNK